jgi:predicted alpha/beta hydrolase family esterase
MKTRKISCLVVHGGTTFKTDKEYLAFLKNRKIDLKRILRPHQGWKNKLQKELGEDFKLLRPQMPDSTNARYKEWKIWFERIIPFCGSEVILLGHSLGGIFLVKYLAENDFPIKIRATILVATPFDDSESKESLTDFKLPASLKKMSQQGGKIYLVHSRDDPSVPFGEIKKYERALPKAESMIFENRGHFNQETFPEMIKLLKSLMGE